MLFNSYTFLVFYAAVFVAYVGLSRKTAAQNLLLLVSSYVFYAAWDYRFLSLILLSTVVDFFAGLRIEQGSNRVRKRWLLFSLVINLGVLATFKYFDFAADSFCQLTAMLGLGLSIPMAEIILPVGISFYTFQTLSYTIDVYRGRVRACNNPLGFAVYVAFFPQLVAGPIERATHFLPQVLGPRKIRRVDLAIGAQFVLLGYFYKVVLADSIAPMVNQFYASPARYGGSIAWLANLGFAVQIYGDFAGYSMIARGISRWMGFRLMANFRQPFLATSPRDFWTRWHRSLSQWLRRYLYFELGGSRRGFTLTCRNLIVTMLLGGLWHGASWNFVIWGGFHGSLLVGQHGWMVLRPARETGRADQGHAHQWSSKMLRLAKILATFVLMLIGWTLFRCDSLSDITVTFSRMFAAPLADPRWLSFAAPIGTAMTIMLLIDVWKEKIRSELVFLRAPVMVRWSIYSMIVFSLLSVGFRPTSFIYFQF
ncbi:MBOAT family protein [bacterium]|jgi:alginate O-acetyltransferase complex protein AlgI|nr:MBOAT family protein [bacterium]